MLLKIRSNFLEEIVKGFEAQFNQQEERMIENTVFINLEDIF